MHICCAIVCLVSVCLGAVTAPWLCCLGLDAPTHLAEGCQTQYMGECLLSQQGRYIWPLLRMTGGYANSSDEMVPRIVTYLEQ